MKSLVRTVLVSAILLSPLVASAQSVFVNTKDFSFGSGPGGFAVGTQNFSFGVGNGFGSGGCSFTICGVGGTIVYIINSILVPVLFALAFIVFLYGVAKAYIFSHGDPERVKQGHALVLYGIIGFVIMLSLWGLVNIVASTFGLSGAVAPPPPTSY